MPIRLEANGLNNAKESMGPPRPTDSAQDVLTRQQITALAVVLLGYAALSYYSDSVPNNVNLAAGLAVGPVILVGLTVAWRLANPLLTALIAALAGIALYRYWALIRNGYQWGNLVQQAGAYGLVAWGFARTLSDGMVPLCTQLADRLHGPLTPQEIAYTRKATVAWALFYVCLTVAIIVLFFSGAPRVWSFFVNFATFGLIGLMFAAEHTIRRKVLPPGRRGSTLTALRQFLIG